MSMPELERLIADVKADKDLQDKVSTIHPSNEAVVALTNRVSRPRTFPISLPQAIHAAPY